MVAPSSSGTGSEILEFWDDFFNVWVLLQLYMEAGMRAVNRALITVS